MSSFRLLLSLQLLTLHGSVIGQVTTDKASASSTTQVSEDGSTSTDPSQGFAVTSQTSSSSPDNSKGSYELRQDLELLLDELRQVASAIHDVRAEHGELAKNVAEMSVAVKDMSERNMHIRKKVRKMSKVLNKSTHHHKYKDGLKALQRDHQKILHAMSIRNISIASLGHHEDQVNITDILDQQNDMEIISQLNDATEKVNKLLPETTTPSFPEENVDANIIPELVVEPPEGGAITGPSYPNNCQEVLNRGNFTSGVYTIQPEGLATPIKVWCDQKTEGGGWTVMVARMPTKEQLNFSRDWSDYKHGFGDPASEYWIGNEALHVMTRTKRNQLRVNITNWDNAEVFADWRDFKVASEQKYYKLTVSRYSPGSTAGDALKWHNDMNFSTVDRDNDALMGGHCAKTNRGGWWYRGHRGCYQAHPTGRYQNNPGEAPQKSKGRNFDIGPVLVWQNWRGESYYPRTLFLMFRPVLY